MSYYTEYSYPRDTSSSSPKESQSPTDLYYGKESYSTISTIDCDDFIHSNRNMNFTSLTNENDYMIKYSPTGLTSNDLSQDFCQSTLEQQQCCDLRHSETSKNTYMLLSYTPETVSRETKICSKMENSTSSPYVINNNNNSNNSVQTSRSSDHSTRMHALVSCRGNGNDSASDRRLSEPTAIHTTDVMLAYSEYTNVGSQSNQPVTTTAETSSKVQTISCETNSIAATTTESKRRNTIATAEYSYSRSPVTPTRLSTLHVLALAEDNDWHGVCAILDSCPTLSSNIDIFHMTCFHWACTDETIPYETFKRILNYNPGICNQCNASGMYPLHIALNYQLHDDHIALVIECTHPAIVWRKDLEGNLPLTIAEKVKTNRNIIDLLYAKKTSSNDINTVPPCPILNRFNAQDLPRSSVSSGSVKLSLSSSSTNSVCEGSRQSRNGLDNTNMQEINKTVAMLLNEIQELRKLVTANSSANRLSLNDERLAAVSPIPAISNTDQQNECKKCSKMIKIRWDIRKRLGLCFEAAFPPHQLTPNEKNNNNNNTAVATGAKIKRFTNSHASPGVREKLAVGDLLCYINGRNVKSYTFNKIIGYLEHLRNEKHKQKNIECILEFMSVQTLHEIERSNILLDNEYEHEIESEDCVSCCKSYSSSSSTSLSSSLYDDEQYPDKELSTNKNLSKNEEIRSCLPASIRVHRTRTRGEAATFNGYACFGSCNQADKLSFLYRHIEDSSRLLSNKVIYKRKDAQGMIHPSA